MNPSEVIEVRSRTFLRVWAFLATGGFGIIGIWLFSEALTFESNYTLFLFLGGLLGIVYGLISFLMILPAFTKRGKCDFSHSARGKMVLFCIESGRSLFMTFNQLICAGIGTV